MIEVHDFPQKTMVILSPNRSFSWVQSKWVLFFIGGFCLTIALVWSLLGAWFILPFAGLEIGLLTLVMYLVSSSTYQKQILTIDSSFIRLQKGRGRHIRLFKLPRDGIEVVYLEPNHPEDVKKLYLSGKSQRVSLGEFLNLQDQEKLLAILGESNVIQRENKKPVKLAF